MKKNRKKIKLVKPLSKKNRDIISLYGDLEHNEGCYNEHASNGNCTC